MDEYLPQTLSEVEEACARVTRQLARIAKRERQGLPTAEAEAVLREMRITLGLAYASEIILLADRRQALTSRSVRQPPSASVRRSEAAMDPATSGGPTSTGDDARGRTDL